MAGFTEFAPGDDRNFDYNKWMTSTTQNGANENPYGPNAANPWGALTAPVTNEADAIYRDNPATAITQALNRMGGSGNLNSPIYKRMRGLAPGLATLFEVMGSTDPTDTIAGVTPFVDSYLNALTSGYGTGMPTWGTVGDMLGKVMGGGAPGLLGDFFATASPDEINTEILRMAQAAGYTGMGRLALQGLANTLAQKADDFTAFGTAAEEKLGPYMNYLKGTVGSII